MSDVTITFHEANRRYPEVVKEVFALRMKSRSKSKNEPLSDLGWSLSWCTRVDARSFADVMAQISKPQTPKEELSFNEELAKAVSRVVNIGLRATSKSNPRASWAALLKGTVPTEITKVIGDAIVEDRKERAMFEALSPEAKKTEVNSLLSQLSKGSGFMAVQIPVRPTDEVP